VTSPAGSSAPASLGTRLFVALQYVLPQHALSRFIGYCTRIRYAPFKNFIIRAFVRGYRPDLRDALEADPERYPTFNAFFTRGLRPGTRPIADFPGTLVSPVDGTLSEAGRITDGRLLQAKGRDYTLEALLASRGDWPARFRDGWFATIYLAPYDYHRIHLPRTGRLVDAWYVPGRLFSVNRATAAAVPGLFARNERIVCGFLDRESLPFAVILVGALHVGSMATVWHGEVTPRRPRRLTPLPLETTRAPLELEAGAELGRFNMGSTVIVLLPPGPFAWDPALVPGRTLRMGEAIGRTARPLGSRPAGSG
jgi:phosphatidylserine decarboxylase